MQPKFSILVVCLNPGDKLKKTLHSIAAQTFGDYEILVKDGLSENPVTEMTKDIPSLRLIERKDAGIYDAMNQAVEEAKGEYIYFLNCGDVFYDENVLADMAGFIDQNPAEQGIYYGNIYERMTGQAVCSNPQIDAFGCYRNVPCHQACFYRKKLLLAHPFQTEYKVRADYEQFLWCFFTEEYKTGVRFFYKDILIADYEGGGFSETEENRKVSENEHRDITQKYMSRRQLFFYRFLLFITLSSLRTKLSQNKRTAGLYNRLKKMLYRTAPGEK